MKKKLCCILILITLLLNSSIMLVISEAVDAVNQTKTEEDKIKALSEINLTKYENYDTTTENSESGSKGTLVQFNFKTGIEFAEDEEYKAIQKTETNIALPRIENYKPSRVEVIIKSTQATNGGKEAKYEYHSSTGILSIIAENSDYSQKIDNARDEYEIICIYGKECYTDNEERNFKIKLNTYETLNNEEKTKISTEREEEYNCKDTIGGVITTEHETEDIYDGYIKANTLNNENKYETTYNENLKIMVSNKDIAQKIEVKETSEESLYTETSINKKQVLDIIGDKGSIDILDESQNIVKTINKDSETDEDGKIILTYKNRVQNLTIQLNDIEKEGIIEILNSKVIEPSAKIIDNTIHTQIEINGINTIITEVDNENDDKETEEVVKYKHIEENNVQIKSAISDINAKLSNDVLVNNTQNDIELTVTLKTNEPQYSLFKNPSISIEMPNEVTKVSIGTPEIMYDGQVFKIVSSNINKNAKGNKVINIQLQGEQTTYEQSTIIEGANLRIPLTISLTKQLQNTEGIIKMTYSNEMNSSVENKNINVTMLNKIVNIIPNISQTTNTENNVQNGNTAVYEKDGIKAEIIEEIGNSTIGDNGTIYEQQIVKQSLKVTNNSNTVKNISLVVNIPEEMTYVKLQTGGYIKNEEKGYYVYSDKYEYEKQNEKQVTINIKVNPGETKTDFIELRVNDLDDSVQEKNVNISSDLQIDGNKVTQFNVSNIVKQAEISVELQCLLGIHTRRSWVYKLVITNLTDKELKNVKIAFEASPDFKIKDIGAGQKKEGNEETDDTENEEVTEETPGKEEETGDTSIGVVQGNYWTYTIDSLAPLKKDENGNIEEGLQDCILTGEVAEKEEGQSCEYEINGVAAVSVDNITYITNKTRMTGYYEDVEVSMTADKETLKTDEEITYTVNIKNIGKTYGGFDTYTSVNVLDVIPRELEPISVTYNEFELEEETIPDENNPEWEHTVQTYTEQTRTDDLSVLVIPDGYDQEDAPNINIFSIIPEGKTVTMTIKAKAGILFEKTQITNTINITGDYIKEKKASVNTTILKYGEEDNPSTPDTPDKPSNPDNPNNPDKPSNPDTPDTPNTPDNPDTPSDSEKTKISISGIAWLDENEDGKRTTDEKTFSNMEVMLYDYKNSTFIKEDGKNKIVKTDSNGEYKFDNIDKGQYIVVFLYDTNSYKITEYQKEGVLDSKNCDAITKTIGIDGDAVTAGLTNTLTAESNLRNIDIGLIEKKSFDLEIKKYISKIDVQTNDGKVKEYTYDNKQFAKVEIHSKKVNGATVVIEYKMVVTNTGEVEGKAVQIVDKLPNGLNFRSELNSNWYESDGKLYTNSLSEKTLGIGEREEISLVLTKQINSNDIGTVVNNASIGISNNDKAIEDINNENDSSDAQVIIGVSTGLAQWLGMTIGTLVVLSILAIMIWKNKKILKGALFVSLFAICIIGNAQQVFGASFGKPDKNITITGVLINGTIPYAIGSDGKTYHCNQKGYTFCNQPHGAKLSKTTRTKKYTSSWKINSNVTQIKLTNKTDSNQVALKEFDNNYNMIGPFSIESNVNTTSSTIQVCYTENGTVKKRDTSNGLVILNKNKSVITLKNLKGTTEFYIKISKTIQEVHYIRVTGNQHIEKYRSRKYKETYTYIYDTWKLAGDLCPASSNPTQDMTRTESKNKTLWQGTDLSANVIIQVNQALNGDLVITKVDDEDNSIVLNNVKFKVQKGNSKSDANKFLSIYKDGNKIEEIVGNEIVFNDDENEATINGVGGYKVQFSAKNSEASILITNDVGKITMKNLSCGEYGFFEVENKVYGYTNTVIQIVDLTIPATINYKKIYNEKKVGDLSIIKVGKNSVEDTEDKIRLENIPFRLKATDANGNKQYIKIKGNGEEVEKDADGWLTRAVGTVTIDDTNDSISNPTYTYTTKESATIFETNITGRITINNLLKELNGKKIQYYLEEISNTNYGYVITDEEVAIDDIDKEQKVVNIQQVGDLYVKKTDDRNTNENLAGVEFVIKSSYANNQYIKIKSNGEWKTRIVGTDAVDDTKDAANNPTLAYTSNIEEATKFVTDEKGEFCLKNLLASADGKNMIKYKIEEIKNPNYGYLIDAGNYTNYKVTYEGKNTTADGTTTLNVNDTVVVAVKNHQEYIRLEGYVWEEIATSKNNSINNLYNNTDALMQGIKVYLYKDGKKTASTETDSNGWYQFGSKKSNGDNYTSEDYLNEANGNLKIDDLDKYYIEFEYDGLRFTPIEVNMDYSSNNYNITSKASEEQSGRGDRKDRQSVNADFTEITNGKSRNNGREVYTLEYDFSNNVSTYKDHWGYQYNENKTKLKVTPSNDYTIIASTKTSGFNLKNAWSAQCEKEAKETLTGINLGVERREQSDLAISTDISSLNVVVQNYENTYTYENRKEYEGQDEGKDGFGTEVKFGNKYGTSYSNRGLNMYTRRIYESDLAIYNQNYANNSDLMQIYVTYKIVVKNQSNVLTSMANELTNYYDSRYVIAGSWIVNGNNTQQIGAKGWSNTSKYGNSYNENGYTAGYTKATSDMKIAPNGKIEVYIKFRLKPEAVKALIEKQTTLNNVTEISAFSTTTFSNNKWSPYASIDVDSNPGSVTSIKLDEDNTTNATLNGREYEIENKTLNKDDYEDDTDMAPSLILGIEDAEPTRGLSGTVFEDEDALHNDDNAHPGEERLGDGILHTGGEYRGKGKYGKIDGNRISGAKVELLEFDARGNTKVATLYKLKVNESGVITTITEEAVTNTDNKGEYLFTGVVPGRYLIRYTYGNNCYIMNSAGEQIEQINALDYKSTTITSDIMKVALNLNKKYSSANEREGDLNWILKYDSTPDNDNYTTDTKSKSKDLSGLIRYSGATDDINKREKSDDLYNGLYKNDFEMTADTAFFDVGVEYSEVKELNGFANRISYTNYTDEYQLEGDKILVLDENGKLKIADTFYAVNPYQDFGIIERARQDYDTNKRISNLKITLANGLILINGNPYKQLPENAANIDEYWNNLESTSENPLPYVKALPGQVVAEIDNEILQGATLNVEYTISIRNKSEMDYIYKNNQDYYYYGKNGQEKNNTAIRKVVDYMDDSLAYDDQQNSSIGWQKVNASDLYNWTKDQDNNSKQLIAEDVKKAVEKGYTIAVTEYFYQSGQSIEPGSIGNVKIYGSKVLSTSEKGVSVENHAEIIETMGGRTIRNSTPGNYNPNTRKPDEPDDDMTSLIITPPTGLNDNKIFIFSISLIVFIALAGGVYFIKKKVL